MKRAVAVSALGRSDSGIWWDMSRAGDHGSGNFLAMGFTTDGIHLSNQWHNDVFDGVPVNNWLSRPWGSGRVRSTFGGFGLFLLGLLLLIRRPLRTRLQLWDKSIETQFRFGVAFGLSAPKELSRTKKLVVDSVLCPLKSTKYCHGHVLPNDNPLHEATTNAVFDPAMRRLSHVAMYHTADSFLPIASEDPPRLSVAESQHRRYLHKASLAFGNQRHHLRSPDLFLTHRCTLATHPDQRIDGDISIEFLRGHYHGVSTPKARFIAQRELNGEVYDWNLRHEGLNRTSYIAIRTVT